MAKEYKKYIDRLLDLLETQDQGDASVSQEKKVKTKKEFNRLIELLEKNEDIDREFLRQLQVRISKSNLSKKKKEYLRTLIIEIRKDKANDISM